MLRTPTNQKLLLLIVVVALSLGGGTALGQGPTLHQATLFSRIGHKDTDYGKSAYNFYAMARSDQWPNLIKNRAHLIYGNGSYNNDSDWFSVSAGGPELTRIKDLGEKQWADFVSTPFVPVTPHSTEGIPGLKRGQSYEEVSEGRITKVVAGHMYVIHIKGPKEDFYVMLRVEELVPSDRCTISWRVVPPPDEAWSQ